LGRISFALYLVHGPCLWILGDRIYASVGWVRQTHLLNISRWCNLFPLPRWGPLGLEFGFLVPNLVMLPFPFWVAEMATKLFDEPSVRFAQWLYRRMLESGMKSWGEGQRGGGFFCGLQRLDMNYDNKYCYTATPLHKNLLHTPFIIWRDTTWTWKQYATGDGWGIGFVEVDQQYQVIPRANSTVEHL